MNQNIPAWPQTAENQAQQIIGQRQITTLSNFVISKKDRLFNKCLAKTVDENNNSLVFKIDSKINTTKNGETKICRAIQELKHLANRSDGNDRGRDRQQIAEQSIFFDRKYFEGGKKWKKTLISFLIVTPVNLN